MFIKKLTLIASLATTSLYTAAPRQEIMTDSTLKHKATAEFRLTRYSLNGVVFTGEQLNKLISFQEKCHQTCCSCKGIAAMSLATCFLCPSTTTFATGGLATIKLIATQEIAITKLYRENAILRILSRMEKEELSKDFCNKRATKRT